MEVAVRPDTGILLPSRRPVTGGGRKVVFPIHEAEVGDIFFVPGSACYKKINKRGTTYHLATVNFTGARPGTEWATRRVTENGVAGVRVWRTK